MTSTYDIIPITHAWIEDGEPVAGDLYAFDRAVATHQGDVDGLWRFEVTYEDGFPGLSLSYVTRSKVR